MYLREYANPDAWRGHFRHRRSAAEPGLRRRPRTFAAPNTPSTSSWTARRASAPTGNAGQLRFTARVAADLCGHSAVERNFLENFLLPPKFAHLPDGMLPMCYPADHHDGVFIANWGLWFVIQLDEYLARSGATSALIDALKPKVLALFAWFAGFLNSDGLLERLPGWVFIEWSKANTFTQDVSYPSKTMVYAAALDAAGRLYNDAKFSFQSAAVRAAILEAVVRRRVLRRQRRARQHRPHRHPQPQRGLPGTTPSSAASPAARPTPSCGRRCRADFGPQRKTTGKLHPDIHPANAFIGNYLRLELLSRYGCCQQVLDESIGYLHFMADRTGTLWESDSPTASCSHGFASHVVRSCYRDVLGFHRLDPIHRTLALPPSPTSTSPAAKAASPSATRPSTCAGGATAPNAAFPPLRPRGLPRDRREPREACR